MQAHRLAEFFLLPGVPISRSGPRRAGGLDGGGQGDAEGTADGWGGYAGGIHACTEMQSAQMQWQMWPLSGS